MVGAVLLLLFVVGSNFGGLRLTFTRCWVLLLLIVLVYVICVFGVLFRLDWSW